MDRESLIKLYQATRTQTERLCEPLASEDYIPQPIDDVSPPKWHLAHTTWFFENFILCNFSTDYQPFHDSYHYLFNSYYEHEGERWQRPKRGHLSRPTVKEVYQYRAVVDDALSNFLAHIGDEDFQKVQKIMQLGIHHEQQHQELLITDLKFILCSNPTKPVYKESSKNHTLENDVDKSYLIVDSGLYDIGHDASTFAFDNESPAHKTFLNKYQIRRSLITNEEYIEFINNKGYQDFRHWLMEGWEWVKTNQITAPLYWEKRDHDWYEMTLNGLQKVVPNAPVTHISYYEAEAFATWAGKRLPKEAEWEIAVKQIKLGTEHCNFLEDNNFHPVPSSKSKDDISSTKFLGDVWEWTGSAYLPYHGYRQSKGALGEYNGKFMVNQMVLRGGSCVTPRKHIRTTYRNFFHPDKRWQFTGIRLAEDL